MLQPASTREVRWEIGNQLIHHNDGTFPFPRLERLTKFRTNIRFGSRPSYGGESSRRPTGYESAPSGGYGYGNGGNGGYASGKPSGYWGSTASGGYGISGTFANGDEFGPVEPNYPEGNGRPHPNIQAQKVINSAPEYRVNSWILIDKIVSSGCGFESTSWGRFTRSSRCFGHKSCSSTDRYRLRKKEAIEF